MPGQHLRPLHERGQGPVDYDASFVAVSLQLACRLFREQNGLVEIVRGNYEGRLHLAITDRFTRTFFMSSGKGAMKVIFFEDLGWNRVNLAA